MYVHICIKHQQISIDGEGSTWRYSQGDVTDVAMAMCHPVVITTCPQCQREKTIDLDFLRRTVNVEQPNTVGLS